MSDLKHRNALPVGYELHWFKIESVLGQGGFGLTYLARDINLERMVAIKEYLPSQISVRENDMFIHPTSKEVEEDYQWGLDRFISEARILTRFEHPSLVRVFNVFEANNSAYMVMNYEQGKSLKEILKGGYTFSEDELIRLIFSLMNGLEAVHKEGFVHRDIKPGNIFIRADGGPVLLDFGSARQTRGKFTTKTLTNFVSPGYAPIEQYAGKSDRQGPWTDIYGLGATAYEVMTGNMPEASIDRSAMISNEAGDNLIQVSLICKDKYSDTLLAAIDHALAFNIQDRPQTIAEWREEFGIDQNKLETLKIPSSEIGTFAVTAPPENLDHPTNTLTAKTFTARAPAAVSDLSTEKLVTTLPDTAVLEPVPPAMAHSRYKSFMVVIGAVGILAVSFIGYHTYWRVSRQPPLSEPGVEVVSALEDVPIPNEDPTAVIEITSVLEDVPRANGDPVIQIPITVVEEEIVPAGPTTEEKISELLELAKKDIVALRLTTPEGNNAYDKFLSVLSLDQENLDAVRGIDSITDRYLQLVYADIEAKNIERAEQYLQKANYLRPEQPKILAAREALDNATWERDRPKTVLGKIKSLFK
jgi:serine/threonine protein kinase